MGGLRSRAAAIASFQWGMEEAQEQSRSWLEGIRKGEPGAFHSLFLRHSGELLGFVHCLLGDVDRSEGIVQDVFLDLYRSRRRVAPGVSPRSELYRRATERVLDEVRQNGGTSAASERPGGARVLGAVMRLPFRQRLALLLSRVPSLQTHEVAGWLDVTAEELQQLVLAASRSVAAELYDGCTAIREAS